MAVFIKEKNDIILGERNIGKVSFVYNPMFDGKLEPYTKNNSFIVTESNPDEIQNIIKEQNSAKCVSD